MFKPLEGCLTVWGPLEGCPLLGQVVQGARNGSEITDKCAVITRQAAESTYFGDIARRRSGSNRCYFVGIAFDAAAAHNVAKE